MPLLESFQKFIDNKWRAGLALALFFVGLALFFKTDADPGDLGDARFNMYVLEHGYRWLVRLDDSFWSAPFFYPARNVIAYSDNHLGSFLAYSLFRILGADRETAFQLWAIAIFSLNYFVTYAVVRRQNLNPDGAIACAYLFTFPMIMAVQMGHVQLTPRFMVPIAFWMTTRFVETARTRHLALLLAASAFQIYLGIYIGFFLILSLVPFFFFLIFLKKRWIAIRCYVVEAGARALIRRGLSYAGSAVAFTLVLLPIAVPYYQVQQEIGGRRWEEVVTMLPRWQSYLYAPGSVLWGKMLRFGDVLPMASEHALFFGLLPCLALAVFLYLKWKKKELPGSDIGFAMAGALLAIVIFTLYSKGFSLYRYAWAFLPGAESIRGVSRIVFVLLYFMSFISGAVVTYVINCVEIARGKWNGRCLGFAILSMAALDQAAIVPSVRKSECRMRVDRLKAKIEKAGHKALWVSSRENQPPFVAQLDAMLVAQDLGLNAVNGYSGLAPKFYPVSLWDLTDDKCDGISLWARLHPGTLTDSSLLQIDSHCQIPQNDYLPMPMVGFTAFEEKNSIQALATSPSAELRIPWTKDNELEILSFDLSTVKIARLIRISAPDGQTQYVHLVPGQNQHVQMAISPRKGEDVVTLDTRQEGAKVGHGKKTRWFYFISNMHLRPLEQ